MSKMGKGPLKLLASWFDRQKRVLPWRDEPSVYRVWISEVMLQQTQVATVIPYFERFLARFPAVESLARARQEDVLLHWAGLGYYSRARNLHAAAQVIVARGKFPKTREAWLELPGIGDYTAGAILSIAQGFPEAILDGNVERVLSRVYRIGRQDGDKAYKTDLWRIAGEWVERAHELKIPPSTLNQAMMELGATLCSPRKPKCQLCPVSDTCQAHRMDEEESFPPPKKPKVWIAVSEEVHCALDPEDRVLLRKREKGEWRAGLWDFPDAKSSCGYGYGRGCKRLGTIETRHVVTRHKITRLTHVWRLPKRGAGLRAAESAVFSPDLKWVSLEKPDVAVGSPLVKTWILIRERFL